MRIIPRHQGAYVKTKLKTYFAEFTIEFEPFATGYIVFTFFLFFSDSSNDRAIARAMAFSSSSEVTQATKCFFVELTTLGSLLITTFFVGSELSKGNPSSNKFLKYQKYPKQLKAYLYRETMSDRLVSDLHSVSTHFLIINRVFSRI